MTTHTPTTKRPARKAGAPKAPTAKSLAQRIKAAAESDVAEVIELKVTNRKASTTKATPRKRAAKVTAPTTPEACRVQYGEAHDEHMAINGECPWCGASTPAPTKRTRKAKAAPTPILADNDGPATPTGYVVRWPHAGYDLLRSDGTTEGPAWLVRCNAHGATTEAANTKSGDQLGRKADRATWCAGCKAAK
jgi:nitrite reductase/ring-hydroxylating ferredoxin subunit